MSPSEFANSGSISQNRYSRIPQFQSTNRGLQATFKVLPASGNETQPGDLAAILHCHEDGTSKSYGIFIHRVHDNNYVRVLSDRLTIFPSSWLHQVLPLAETISLFAKPELAGTTWSKCDELLRIAGFRLPGVLIDRTDNQGIWIDEVVLAEQFSWESGIFSFQIEMKEKISASPILKCGLNSHSDCEIEIWLQYDPKRKYGTYNGEEVVLNDANGSEWTQDDCCEWKVQNKAAMSLRFAYHHGLNWMIIRSLRLSRIF